MRFMGAHHRMAAYKYSTLPQLSEVLSETEHHIILIRTQETARKSSLCIATKREQPSFNRFSPSHSLYIIT